MHPAAMIGRHHPNGVPRAKTMRFVLAGLIGIAVFGDQRREHIIRHIGNQPDIVILQNSQ